MRCCLNAKICGKLIFNATIRRTKSLMKRTSVIALWLLIVALPVLLMAKQKAAPVDLKGMNRVFLGWVDISPDDYHHQGYATREEYLAVINHANTAFQEYCQSKAFSGRTMTAAKARGDENTAGNDVYVKFSEWFMTTNIAFTSRFISST